MTRKIGYWAATGLVTIAALSGGISYPMSTPHAVENFQHVGYPQQLRILLGIGKVAGVIVLLLPRLPVLKEWAYASLPLCGSRQRWPTTWRMMAPSRWRRSRCSDRWRFRT